MPTQVRILDLPPRLEGMWSSSGYFELLASPQLVRSRLRGRVKCGRHGVEIVGTYQFARQPTFAPTPGKSITMDPHSKSGRSAIPRVQRTRTTVTWSSSETAQQRRCSTEKQQVVDYACEALSDSRSFARTSQETQGGSHGHLDAHRASGAHYEVGWNTSGRRPSATRVHRIRQVFGL